MLTALERFLAGVFFDLSVFVDVVFACESRWNL